MLSMKKIKVSIHAPRAGRDPRYRYKQDLPCRFQSTRPVRGAPLFSPPLSHFFGSFNPRAPCGARPWDKKRCVRAAEFQSTRPVRGATREVLERTQEKMFQSTRPVRGATPPRIPTRTTRKSFNPRAPCGARQRADTEGAEKFGFNPRAPCGARLFFFAAFNPGVIVSIHAPRAGRDPRPSHGQMRQFVSIHAPRAGRDVDLTHGTVKT